MRNFKRQPYDHLYLSNEKKCNNSMYFLIEYI